MDVEGTAEAETEAIFIDAELMPAIGEGLTDAEAERTSSHEEVVAHVSSRAAVRAAAASADGIFEPNYLSRLRQDWSD